MAAPAAPDPQTVVIDGKTYELAIERGGRIAHTVQSRGQDLRWERDFRSGSNGMGETVERSQSGYMFTDNMDRTRRGLRLSPTVTTVTLSGLSTTAREYWFFEDTDSSSVRYVYFSRSSGADTVTIDKIRASDDAVRNTRVFTIAATGGAVTAADTNRPERFNGFWWHAIDIQGGGGADTQCFMKLTTVSTTTANDTWDVSTTEVQGVRCIFYIDSTEGNLPRLGRVNSTDNQVQTIQTADVSVTNPLVDANWADAGIVGDLTGFANKAASHAGYTFLGKGDNLYAWDPSGNSYGVIPFGIRYVASNTQRSQDVVSYGDRVFYTHQSGIWMVTGVSSAKLIGVDQIPYYTNAPNITSPIRLFYLEGAVFGEWAYFIYTSAFSGATTSYLLAANIKRDSVSGLPVTWHTILTRSNQMRRPFIDSSYRLWWAEPGQTRLAYIQLANDGSPDSSTRGNTGSTYEDYESETDFGLPEITKQFRYAFVEIEGGTANCSWQVKYYLDGGTVNSLGSALTTSSGNLNWTVGTNDTGRRLRMRLTATTNGSHSTSTDPKVIRLIVYARSPDQVRVIVTPTAQRNLFETEKILRKLVDAGPVTIREWNETHTGYIRSANTVWYSTDQGNEQGIEVLYDRFTVAA